jgi:mannose-6-phosphate isomerase
MNLYPFVFHPRFVEKIWGGRKLQSVLGKSLPSEKSIGESWELFDFPPGVVDSSGEWVSSVVSNGPLAGKSLHWLVTEHPSDLLGTTPLSKNGQFPILIKFLDAREDLSVQVHPDQSYADANPDAHLKSEAWYVIQHDSDARLLKGLHPTSSREKFAAALATGEVENHIRAIKVKPGDCHYLPSGTVHALGAGILVAEVQTPSDTTFRVFDFNRVDPSTGQQRKLHVEQAMQCIDFDNPAEPDQPRSHVAGPHTTVSRLVTSPYFTMEKVRFSEGVEQPVPFKEPVVWIMLEGSAQIKVDGYPEPTKMKMGETVLLPASMKNPVLKTLSDCVWLEVTFPVHANPVESQSGGVLGIM